MTDDDREEYAKPWNERRPFSRPWVWALFLVMVFALSPCNSGPLAIGYFYGWRWGLAGFFISWGAILLYNCLYRWRIRKMLSNVS